MSWKFSNRAGRSLLMEKENVTATGARGGRDAGSDCSSCRITEE